MNMPQVAGLARAGAISASRAIDHAVQAAAETKASNTQGSCAGPWFPTLRSNEQDNGKSSQNNARDTAHRKSLKAEESRCNEGQNGNDADSNGKHSGRHMRSGIEESRPRNLPMPTRPVMR